MDEGAPGMGLQRATWRSFLLFWFGLIWFGLHFSARRADSHKHACEDRVESIDPIVRDCVIVKWNALGTEEEQRDVEEIEFDAEMRSQHGRCSTQHWKREAGQGKLLIQVLLSRSCSVLQQTR